MIVYLITNAANGKCYIGKTNEKVLRYYLARIVNASNRFRQGRKMLGQAIRKYGGISFSISLLMDGIESNEQACYWEKAFIAAFHSQNKLFGYNMTSGGDGAPMGSTPWNKGKTNVYTESTKGKISIALRGKKFTDERRKNLSESLRGHKGCMHTEEAKQKMRAAHLGIKMDATTRLKMSQSAKEAWRRPRAANGELQS